MEVAAFTHGLSIVTNLDQSTASRFREFARYLVHVDEIADDSSHFCGRNHIFLNLKNASTYNIKFHQIACSFFLEH